MKGPSDPREDASARPLVSIVINNYNNGPFLSDCLDALLAQTYTNIELIVVDALSSDSSRETIDRYAAGDERVRRVYCASYEKFPAITYNIGFLNCRGDYIAINDADDISLPGRIEAQVEYLLNNESVGVVGCNCYEFDGLGSELVETSVERNVRAAAPPARNPCLMFRKDVLARHGLWRWRAEYAADFELLYRWYAGGVRFHILPEALVMYRRGHGGSVSVKKLFNQGVKLALFRTIYGVRLFREVGIGWWYATLKTYAFLTIKYPARVLKEKASKRWVRLNT